MNLRNFSQTKFTLCLLVVLLFAACVQKNSKKVTDSNQNDGTPKISRTDTSLNTIAPWQPNISLNASLLSTEHLFLMPTYAKLTTQGWSGRLQLSVYKEMSNILERKTVQSTITMALNIPDDAVSQDNFQRRIKPFLANNVPNREVTLSMHGKYVSRLSTGTDGDVVFDYADPDASQIAEQLKQEGSFPIMPTIQTSPGVYDEFPGATIEVIRPKGLSIISDIDDTIKVTNVGSSKTELLKVTFIDSFVAVPQMSELYQHFKNDCKATLHYLSSSPEQLAPEFWRFFREAGFPLGPMHLKRMRLKDKSFLQLIADPVPYKTEILEKLFNEFPERQFVLVGDTGEKDPEIYADLLNKRPSQVRRILLRIKTPSATETARLNALFSGNAKVTSFQDASSLEKKCGL